MDAKLKVEQKINRAAFRCIHNNPLNAQWNLASRQEAYRWSSAEFYESGKDEFGVLMDYGERF